MGYQDSRRDGAPNRYEDEFRADRYRGGRGYAGGEYRADRSDRSRNSGGRTPPADYHYDDRGFFDRAGDEVRSWFGDEEAERRREYDEYMNRRYGDPRDQSSRLGFASSGQGGYEPGRGYQPFTGERSGYGSADHGRAGFGPGASYGQHHDSNYLAWREERMSELDRDYHEYQNEHRARFNNEFGNWRQRRTQQRGALAQVSEHMDVVGSDGEHVGTVDKCAGDRIILTKNDKEAQGVHHSIPSRWIDKVEGQTVTLEKTAAQAQDEWRSERERQAMFGDDRNSGSNESNPAWVSRSIYMRT